MKHNNSDSENRFFPNVLLITGSGRERGKTLLACNIIRTWRMNYDFVAIKISAHNHGDPCSKNLIHRSENQSIWEEMEISAKDSGRFLESGARRVFYIEAHDQELSEAFRLINDLCNKKSMIICESGGLRRYIKPGVMLFVQHADDIVEIRKQELFHLSDRIIFSSSPELSDPTLTLEISDHQWKLVTVGQTEKH